MKDSWNKNALGYGINDKTKIKFNSKKKTTEEKFKDKDPWNKDALGYGQKK